MKCLNMSWVSALLMCQEISMVMATEAYEINKSKTGHPVGESTINAKLAHFWRFSSWKLLVLETFTALAYHVQESKKRTFFSSVYLLTKVHSNVL